MAKNKVLTKHVVQTMKAVFLDAAVTTVGLEALPLELMKMANKLKKLCMDELERKFQKSCLKSVDEFEVILMK